MGSLWHYKYYPYDGYLSTRKAPPSQGAASQKSASYTAIHQLPGCLISIRYFFAYLCRLWLWLKSRSLRLKLPHNQHNPSIADSGANTPKTTTTTQYTIMKNGVTISLSGITTSLYPFSKRNTSRSSARSSRSHSVKSRKASQSSGRSGSLMSRRSAADSYYELPLSNLESPSTRPHLYSNPRRQWSTSMPQLHTRNGLDRDGSTDIEVTSPILGHRNHSQNSLDILPNSQPFSYVPDDGTVISPTHFDQTSFEMLPSPVPMNAHNLSRSNDHGERSYRRPTYSPPEPSFELRYIRTAFPSETRRYTMRTRLPKMRTNLTFPPINLDYSKPSPPDGWARYVHPEGARSFYNKNLGIYTESEIYDPEILGQLQADYAQLKAISGTFENPFPPTGEFVINVYREKNSREDLAFDDKPGSTGELVSEYYCVDHATRLIFFLKESRSDWTAAWHEVEGVRSAFQFQLELLSQYWYFVQLYPSAIDLTGDMVRELRDIVLFQIEDITTSPASTAYFPRDDLYSILSLTGELERNVGPGSYGSMCLLAHKMYIFTCQKFLNFHGESYARLGRASVYGDRPKTPRTLLSSVLSYVMFSASEDHLRRLQGVWIDGMMHRTVWKDIVKQLNEEWQEFVFFATVVLNANVAFLAIQSVDIEMNPYRSPAQILSYLSIIANIGSIIIGLFLKRQNRVDSSEDTESVAKYLSQQGNSLQHLAILFSLPYALAMWS
ncbi:hypothetical protein D9619_007314 [Psilocybe cf. subviscida]|uniref:Uncharacterized protein n=1 Tax=Psilocybe cf. subviscida TaxID=2480587 RepID=A0A8H5EX06_9AGAR|nr:hypothetical protein D9619_007314 [Psilocybe cf. subviscida]